MPALLCATAACLAAFAPTALAAPGIEGIWSFNGGRIAVQETEDGSFSGTVVSPTRFSLCTHPQGEEIWTQMTPRPDGSYWGFHSWFFETAECIHNPVPGQTAWRVIDKDEGSFLRACFSEPGSGMQPTIAADGSVSDATYGCVDSALISAVPDAPPGGATRYVLAPSAAACFMRRRLRIVLRDPTDDPIERAVVLAGGGGVKARARLHHTKGGMVAIIGLARLPDTFTVRVRLTTVLGHHLKSRRTYHRCRGGAPR